MDLHTFHTACITVAQRYLQPDLIVQDSYREYVHRLSAYFTQVPCTALLQYDRAVRERVALGTWATFNEASTQDDLWLSIVYPELTAATAFPQFVHMRQQPWPLEATCAGFLSREGCAMRWFTRHVRFQICPDGVHLCFQCGHRSDGSARCPTCAPGTRQRIPAGLGGGGGGGGYGGGGYGGGGGGGWGGRGGRGGGGRGYQDDFRPRGSRGGAARGNGAPQQRRPAGAG